ncbi:MAG: substrate-binding domain-containing protein [Verrucomicrobiales bacterium]|nr:substrate-binding domain-containing protein [Verrucomicrobiales bacterium]
MKGIWLRLTLFLSLSTGYFSKAADPIKIDGSNGARPIVQALATGFSETPDSPEIKVGTGMSTTERIEALAADSIQIASASHGIEPERTEPHQLDVFQIGRMAVVFAVHETVRINNLSTESLLSLFSGKITNWSTLGGPDLPVVLLMRPEDEVDTEVVRASIKGMANLAWASSIRIYSKSGDLADALNATPGAIGITSSVRLVENKHISAISIDGIPPGESEIRSGTYRLSRGIYLLTQRKPKTEVTNFLNFTDCSAGMEILKSMHCIPTGLIKVSPGDEPHQ